MLLKLVPFEKNDETFWCGFIGSRQINLLAVLKIPTNFFVLAFKLYQVEETFSTPFFDDIIFYRLQNLTFFINSLDKIHFTW